MIANIEIYKKHIHSIDDLKAIIEANDSTIRYIREKWLSWFEFTEEQFFEFREDWQEMEDMMYETMLLLLAEEADEVDWEVE